jgi:hypothetical protein
MKKINWKRMKIEEIAAAICSHLHDRGMECVLSGGGCVSIYSNNIYKSSDLDFVMAEYPREDVDTALEELGFKRSRSWRHFENPNCPYLVEFPPTPLAVGEETLSKVRTMSTGYGKLRLLRAVDCVKDRLAAFYHWNDRQSLEQAVMVAVHNRISYSELKRWSEGEGSLDKYQIFLTWVDEQKLKSL